MRLPPPTRAAVSILGLSLAILPLTSARVRGQDAPAAWRARLPQVVPGADRFSEREGEPPVVRAYRRNADGAETLVGYAFLTSDAPPEQMGFDGPIEVLVGMDLDGTLTGVHVIDYVESLRRSRGDFLARPGFQEQFAGKRLTDPFQVRRDVDGISGATITVDATARGIRNAARRVALAHRLGEVSAAADAPLLDPVSVTLQELERLSWSEMVLRGLVPQIRVLDGGGTVAELSLFPLRDEAVAELLIGPEMLADVRERAGPLARDRQLVLAGVDGPWAGALNLARITVDLGDQVVRLESEDVLLFGRPEAGKLDGQVRFVRILLVDRAVDLTRPFTFVLDLRPGQDVYTAEYPGRREAIAEAEEPVLLRTLGSTSWGRVGALALLLALAGAAFVTRRERLRWAALGTTLLFLGVFDKGFLSVSHITSGIKVGPAVFLSDLPLLLLVAFTVVTTLLWGRVFCGYLCPFGVLQDLLERVVPRRFRRELPHRVHRSGALLKYGVLALVVTPAAVGSGVSLFQYFEPFGTVFFPSRSLVLWTIAGAILAASAVVPRFYCRYMCPLGAALALGSVLAPFGIRRVEQCAVCKVCEQRCPTRAIHGAALDFKECVRCNVCEIKLVRKAGVCRHDMAAVRARLVRRTALQCGP